MIHFQCPSCGHSTNVAPQYAGQTGPCASCGKPVTIPYPYAPSGGASGGSSTGKVLLIVFGVLVLVGVAGSFLLLPALTAARDAARSSACKNNLKSLALALQNHHDSRKTFPPAYIADEDGTPLHSWRVLILPYIDQTALYDRIRLDEPWDSPHNRQFHSQMPEVFSCPSDGNPRDGFTNYMVVVESAKGVEGGTVFIPGQMQKFGDEASYRGEISVASIKDGTSNTVAVVEVSNSTTNWMEPVDLDLDEQIRVNDCEDGSCLSSQHRRGVNVAFVDGSVKTLSENVSRETLRKLFLRNDGQIVDSREFE